MNFVIWRDIDVLYKAKEHHAKSVKNQKLFTGFGVFCGEVPVANFNDVTKKFEDAINLRGRAYGARKRLCYRRRAQELRHET